jgi:ribosomal protein S18 acetylase RimI-like enzyme
MKGAGFINAKYSLQTKNSLISPALPTDIPFLEKMINAAYRGNASRGGWTTEADLVDGDIRIDSEGLRDLLQNPAAIILKYEEEEKTLGCVYLEKQDNSLYLGMLTVSPGSQDKGIGKKLLQAAELFGQQQHCRQVIMHVITARTELINWYQRHGYSDTGERKPFPPDSKFGKAIKPIEFLVLKKDISRQS